jgi:hypothetical protein
MSVEIGNLSNRDFEDIIKRDDLPTKYLFRAAFRRSIYLVSKVITSWNEPRNLMASATFKERQDWLQWVVCEHKRGLLEDPRGYIKSSGCTRSVPIFVLIQRPHEDLDHPNEVARAVAFLETHRHIKGPDSRLLVLGDSESNAARFTGSTLNIINTNPLFRWLYPEVIWPNPNRRDYKCEYNAREWTTNGRFNPTEANAFVRAAGAETAIVGGRADGDIFNDLVGEHNYRSATEMERQRDFVKTGAFLLENRDPRSPEGGFVIVEGNRWGLDDVNSMIHDQFGEWSIWRRSILKCIVHGSGSCGRHGSDEAKLCGPSQDPLWLERTPDMASIERIITDVGDPEKVAAQLFNDPTRAADMNDAHMLPFVIDLRPVRAQDGKLTREYCAIVAVAGGGEEVIPIASMDPHVISVDPAASDEPGSARTAILWIARDRPTGRRFWLECVAERWAADSGLAESAIVDLFERIVKWTGRTPQWALEKVAAQTYLASAVQHLARARRVRVGDPVLVKPTRNMAKEDRIKRRLGFVMGQGLLYVRSGLQLPRKEVRHFPTSTLDTLDAGAQAEEIFSTYRGTVVDDERRSARQARRLQRIAEAGRTGAAIN